MNRQSVQFPLVLVSETNRRTAEHWTARNARVDHQRRETRIYLLKCFGPGKHTLSLDNLHIKLTRYSPTLIKDSDNLVSAFKSVRDELADFFGFDDGDKRVRWSYDQVKAPASMVGIEIGYTTPCIHCGGRGYR